MRTQKTIEMKAIALKAIAVLAMLAFALSATAHPQTASAAEMLDASQKGSLAISPESTDGKAVSGTFEIYKVADAVADGTGWHFEWAEGYEDTDHALYDQTGELSDTYKSHIVGLLESKVASQEPTQKSAAASETTTFSNLTVGLYYVKMADVQDGYETISPFLVSIPTSSADGTLTYNVTANSKAGTAAVKPSTPSEPETPAATATNNLPQTGQLWWPVFVLGAAGAGLIVAGVVRRRSATSSQSR